MHHTIKESGVFNQNSENMKTSIKAAIYSGVVFPGTGYFVVGKILRGIIACLITIAALSIIVMEINHKVQIISEKIIMGTLTFDPLLIQEQILETTGKFSPEVLMLATYTIGIVWLFSLLDSYLIGKKIQNKKN